MSYIYSDELAMFRDLAIARAKRGRAAVLFLQGPPGGGKTAMAKDIASKIGASFFRYQGSSEKDYTLNYDFDIDGIVKGEKSYVKGPAWQALEASQAGPTVLLIDEVDKTAKSFDSMLLRLLEEASFVTPAGEEIVGNKSNFIVMLTSNGRRSVYPEVMRRCQRVFVPAPSGQHLADIVGMIAGTDNSDLIARVCKNVEAVRPSISDADNWASPVEIANFCDDLECFGANITKDLFWALVKSYLSKDELGYVALKKSGNLYKFLLTVL